MAGTLSLHALDEFIDTNYYRMARADKQRLMLQNN